MHLFFEVEGCYPLGGFVDLEFVFKDAKDLKEKIDSNLSYSSIYRSDSKNNKELGEYSKYNQAEFKIWKLMSPIEFENDEHSLMETDKFLVFHSRPSETIWRGAYPKSKEEVDELNLLLYDSIVSKIW